MAAPSIPKGLIDSKPASAVLVKLDEYHRARVLPEKGLDSEVVYESARAQMMVRTAVKGHTIGTHFHSVSDEIVIVTGGTGELFVNGEWIPVKAGDVHVCPRGIVHDTRALDGHLEFVSIFAPHMPEGNDINWV